MKRLNAYFPASTANPTGRRPWNFAMQDRSLGFYVDANYPLPARTLGRLSGIPSLSISKFIGKNTYGLPQPVYTPLSRNFLGMNIDNMTPAQIARMTGVIQGNPVPYQAPTNTIRRRVYYLDPVASTTSQLTAAQQQALQNQLAQAQQTVNQLTTQQAQYNMAQANAPAMTAAGTPLTTPGTTPAPASASWSTWFTDPTQEIFSGFPNWAVVGAGALAFFWLTGKKR